LAQAGITWPLRSDRSDPKAKPAARRLDLDDIAAAAAGHRLAHRGCDRDPTAGDVCLSGADERELDDARPPIGEANPRPDSRRAASATGLRNARAGKARLNDCDALFETRSLVESVHQLAILDRISAVQARRAQTVGDAPAPVAGQLLQLLLQTLGAVPGHEAGIGVGSCLRAHVCSFVLVVCDGAAGSTAP
jgi:hypothetical protein